ncbi:Domain of uncharacterised function (DUF477) [Moraxella cuniculi]|uniref:Domain of uncharacterized function (DUF477) n=2 Tax=Moraxella cuniculi TaxID=34061 RepID=A0A448GWJ5_9GAMM|nr:Domain of uncharacterised function (DUF477) [Moraxella cuniculi]
MLNLLTKNATAMTDDNVAAHWLTKGCLWLLIIWVLTVQFGLQALANTESSYTSAQEDELAALVLATKQGEQDSVLGELEQSVGEFVNQQDSSANPPEPKQTKTSQAAAVTHDKLILNSPVVDAAGILSADEKQQLSLQLQKIYQDGLAQAALVIVPTTNGMSIFDYAMAVANRWQLGRADTDDGLLIAVAINDRNLYILTGYGLEGVLPDAAVKRIIREQITPNFKQSAYAQGLSAAIAKIDERLRSDPETLARADAAASNATDEAVGIDIIGLFIIALVLGSFLRVILGRLIGSLLGAAGFATVAVIGGANLIIAVAAAFVLLILLLLQGVIPLGMGNHRSGGFGGGFGGGGFGSGGSFGGFGGGGGSFGGGGAGGSW